MTTPAAHSSATAPCAADEKGERLLEAAKDAFLELGYSATSMDSVAQRAKASKTTLYHRFASKEALFAAVVARECQRRGIWFPAESFDGVPLVDALTEIGDRFLDLIWSPEALRINQVVTGEALRQPEIGQIFYDIAVTPSVAMVAAYFERARAAGLIAFTDIEFITTQFMASLQGGPHCALTLGVGEPPAPAERRAYAAQVVKLFVYGATP